MGTRWVDRDNGERTQGAAAAGTRLLSPYPPTSQNLAPAASGSGSGLDGLWATGTAQPQRFRRIQTAEHLIREQVVQFCCIAGTIVQRTVTGAGGRSDGPPEAS